MTITILFLISTIVISSTGIAYAGILTTPGNLLDWVPGKVEKIKNPYIRDLFSCGKCISGQFALWSYIGFTIHFGLFHWFFSVVIGMAWVSWVIVITDQAMKKGGYS